MQNWGKICLICLALTACSADKKLAPTEGRLSLVEQNELLPASGTPQIEKKIAKTDVLMALYNAQNKVPHLKVNQKKNSWISEMDEEIEENLLSFSNVMIENKKIYALDGDFNLFAFDLNGKKIFQKELINKDVPLTMASKNGKIVTISPKGKVVTVDKNGKILWQKDFQAPFRNSPIIYKDMLYLISATNDLWVLQLNNGQEVWHYKTEIPFASWWKMANLSVNNNVVVVPFTNGIVMAFQAMDGSFLWEEDMIGVKKFNQLDQMNQMISSPVIEENMVYLLGHSDTSKAIHLKTGEKIWEIPLGSETIPLISGNTLFVLDNQNDLYALQKSTGKQFWKTPLALEKGRHALYLVDGELLVFGPTQVVKMDPKTGKKIKEIPFDEVVSFPVITQDGYYFITQDGEVLYKGNLE